jgi:hypothetical protein
MHEVPLSAVFLILLLLPLSLRQNIPIAMFSQKDGLSMLFSYSEDKFHFHMKQKAFLKCYFTQHTKMTAIEVVGV